MQITWARIGTRTCFRRFCKVPPMNARSAFDFWFESLRGRTRLYLDSVAYLNTLNGTFVEFEIQTND